MGGAASPSRRPGFSNWGCFRDEVAGVGTIGTPVNAEDTKHLIGKTAQAPYGRGEETIVDTDVHRAWQIEPASFALENPAWNIHVDTIVATVVQEFGITIKQKVKAELYNLLIYEPGSPLPLRSPGKSAAGAL